MDNLLDVRETADLLWPAHVFQPALDTEVISLLTQLPLQPTTDKAFAHQQLRQFMNQVWQKNEQIS